MNTDHTIAILGYNHHDITLRNIRHLRDTGCTDRILLWDNGSDPAYTPLAADLPGVECRREEHNRFVNPVWNDLIESCGTRYLTLLNNDCFVLSPGYFDEVTAHMALENFALTSTKTLRVGRMPQRLRLGPIRRIAGTRPLRWKTRARRQGWLMTIDLHQYRACAPYRIPDYLRLWFGDDWIWYRVISAGRTSAIYTNRFALHLDFPVSITGSMNDVVEADKAALAKYGDWHREYLPVIHCRTRLWSRYV